MSNDEKSKLVQFRESVDYRSISESKLNTKRDDSDYDDRKGAAFTSDSRLELRRSVCNENPNGFTKEYIGFGAIGEGKLFLRREKALHKWRSVRCSIITPGFKQKIREMKVEEARELDDPDMEDSLHSVVDIDDWRNYIKDDMILGKWLNILLLTIPFAVASHYAGWGSKWVFWLNFLAMLPLASVLGDFTEELALHTNEVVGGLVNATFGNAVELVVGIQALFQNEIRIVQASMLGSVFSNLLLVVGCCFFFGGLKFKEQRFNSVSTTANMSLLSLSLIGFVLPTPFAQWYEFDDEVSLKVSRLSALCLASMYFQLLLFQLKTHAHLMDDGDGLEKPAIPFWVALSGLMLVTLIITILSDYLVGSIDEFVVETGISKTFVGMVILPIVGNAVEHLTAVQVAVKDKMDMAMSVAVGSCTQICLFVVPFLTLVGWGAGKPMNMNYPPFEVILLVLSICVTTVSMRNNTSNWLQGSLLITSYVMVSIGFYYEKLDS